LHRESYGMNIPKFTAKNSLKKSGDYGSFTTSKSLVDIISLQASCQKCATQSATSCCPDGQCIKFDQDGNPGQCTVNCKKMS
jgi:hypothetical protein